MVQKGIAHVECIYKLGMQGKYAVVLEQPSVLLRTLATATLTIISDSC